MTSIERYSYAFDPEGNDWPARLLRRVPAGASVLELGPGAGAMTRVLVDRGHSVRVVENDPAALSQLEPLGVDIVASDLDGGGWHEALEGQRFGAALACDVLEHLREPQKVLQALRGLIEPTGCLVISVPNVAYAGILASLRAGVFEYADKGLLDRTHVHFFTRRSIEEMLIDNGWTPIVWDAHRVPLEQSEFAHHCAHLAGAWREHLLMGWPDFDVYQWMAIAVPSASAPAWEGARLRDEVRTLRNDLRRMREDHAQERASLIEHQKAFGEAKVLIGRLQRELDESRLQREKLQKQYVGGGATGSSWRNRLSRLLK